MLTGVTVSRLFMGDQWLSLMRAPQEGIHAWYNFGIGPRGKPTDAVLLNDHIAKLPSKYLFLAIDLCSTQLWLAKLLWLVAVPGGP